MDYFLGSDLIRTPGGPTQGIAHLEAALRTKPDYADAHTNLAGASWASADSCMPEEPKAYRHSRGQ
jgi:hypothetical protein